MTSLFTLSDCSLRAIPASTCRELHFTGGDYASSEMYAGHRRPGEISLIARDYAHWRRARARLFYRSRSPLNWRISFPLSARQDCGRGYYSFFPRKQHESDTNGTTTIDYRLAERYTRNLKKYKSYKDRYSYYTSEYRSFFAMIF